MLLKVKSGYPWDRGVICRSTWEGEALMLVDVLFLGQGVITQIVQFMKIYQLSTYDVCISLNVSFTSINF